MKTTTYFIIFSTTIIFVFPAFSIEVSFSSLESIVATSDGETLFLADLSNQCIYIVDAKRGRKINRIKTQGSPTGLTISKDNRTLYVTCDGEFPILCLFDLSTNENKQTFPLSTGVCSPVLSHDEMIVWVCERFFNRIAVINLNDNSIRHIPAGREPIAARLTPDGSSLVIANHLPSSASNQFKGRGNAKVTKLRGATVRIINTHDDSDVTVIELMRGSTGLKGVAISPDGKYAFVTHVLAYYRLPTKRVTRGFINRNAITIIDLQTQEIFNTILLDDIDHGAANPWAVECSSDGTMLFVTHAGTHEVSIIQLDALMKQVRSMPMYGYSAYGKAYTQSAIPFDLTFIKPFRKRIQLDGFGPRGLTLSKNKIYVTTAYSSLLEVIDINDLSKKVVSLREENEPLNDPVRVGDFYFNDATICLQGWQSCASCHPEGRMDGLNWDLLNDGEGNSKNTKSLLYSNETPPVMSTGVRANAEVAVQAGLQHMMHLKNYQTVAESIATYIQSLHPVKRRQFRNENVCDSTERGAEIFYSQETQCAECHTGEFYTDLEIYDVDTIGDYDQRSEFDTPTLIELWRTAPYLHDGRSKTLEDIFVKWNQNDLHGKTSHLTQQEVHDLVAFLKTL
jgi:DNA-binding beta-propeller fold protein YncE